MTIEEYNKRRERLLELGDEGQQDWQINYLMQAVILLCDVVLFVNNYNVLEEE